jgi:K(+)-stimulated pyrophosphate-energized sodium pump
MGGAIIGLAHGVLHGRFKPVRRVAEAAMTGAGTNVIRGMAVGMESVATCLLLVAGVAAVANVFMGDLGLYGIALAAVGMLGGTAIVMTVDAYGPISDNAGGIAEMAGLPQGRPRDHRRAGRRGQHHRRHRQGLRHRLGDPHGDGALSAYGLEVNHAREVFDLTASAAERLGPMNLALDTPNILIGILIGAVMPFIVSASTMLAVGKAAGAIVLEIKRQFDTIPGLREGTAEPEPKAIVDIATNAALRR